MFEKSALLIICCDRSSKSFENVPIACKNCAKAIKKTLSRWGIFVAIAQNTWVKMIYFSFMPNIIILSKDHVP